MLRDGARKIIEDLEECPIYLLGIMQRKMLEERGEMLFISRMTQHISLLELRHADKIGKDWLKNHAYEELYYNFVMEGLMPTHKYEELYPSQQMLRIHMMCIQRKDFRDNEKKHRKEVSNIMHYAYNIFRRDVDDQSYWGKIAVQKERKDYQDHSFYNKQGSYPFK